MIRQVYYYRFNGFLVGLSENNDLKRNRWNG